MTKTLEFKSLTDIRTRSNEFFPIYKRGITKEEFDSLDKSGWRPIVNKNLGSHFYPGIDSEGKTLPMTQAAFLHPVHGLLLVPIAAVVVQ